MMERLLRNNVGFRGGRIPCEGSQRIDSHRKEGVKYGKNDKCHRIFRG